MDIVFSQITYDDAKKYLDNIRNVGVENETAKNSGKRHLFRIFLITSIFLVWMYRVYPDVEALISDVGEGKINLGAVVSFSVLISICFFFGLCKIGEVLLNKLMPWFTRYRNTIETREMYEMCAEVLNALQVQKCLRKYLDKEDSIKMDIQEERLFLSIKTDGGIHFKGYTLSNAQRSKLLCNGILDFSCVDNDWAAITQRFPTRKL